MSDEDKGRAMRAMGSAKAMGSGLVVCGMVDANGRLYIRRARRGHDGAPRAVKARCPWRAQSGIECDDQCPMWDEAPLQSPPAPEPEGFHHPFLLTLLCARGGPALVLVERDERRPA